MLLLTVTLYQIVFIELRAQKKKWYPLKEHNSQRTHKKNRGICMLL